MNEASIPLTSPTGADDPSVVQQQAEKKPRRFPLLSLLLPVLIVSVILIGTFSLSPTATERPRSKAKRHVTTPWKLNVTLMFPKELYKQARAGERMFHLRIRPSRVNMEKLKYTSKTVCDVVRDEVNTIVNASRNDYIVILQTAYETRCFDSVRYSPFVYIATLNNSSNNNQILFSRINGADAVRGSWKSFCDRIAERIGIDVKKSEREFLESLSNGGLRSMENDEESEREEDSLNHIDLLSRGNDSVMPCDNFYENVCGNFGANAEGFKQQVDQESWDYDVAMKELLKKSTSSNSKAIRKLFDFYKQCTQTLSNSTYAANEYWKYMKNQIVEWPLIEEFHLLSSPEIERLGLRDLPILHDGCLQDLTQSTRVW